MGVVTGGTAPASLVAYELGLPLPATQLNDRAEDNTPQRPHHGEALSSPENGRVLLVDDRALLSTSASRPW